MYLFDSKAIVTFAAFMALGINGMTFALIGTSLPAIQSHLGVDITMAGTMMAVLQVGFTLFTLISGILSDFYRREWILVFGCLLLSFGNLLFCTVSALALNMVFIGIMGAGLGCILSGTNALLIGLYPQKKRKILNIHHVFFSIGSLVGPILMGYLLTQKSIVWRWAYTGQGVMLLFLACLFFLASFSTETIKKRSNFVEQVKSMAKDRSFLLILSVNSLAVGTQLSVMLLGVTYLHQAKQCSIAAAGIALSFFAVTMMLGRVACSRLSATIHNATIILILLGLQMLAMLLIWLGTGWLALLALALSGFSFSGIYPTSLALAGVLFPRVEGSALGVLSTMAGAGSILLCWLIGYIAGLTDLQSGFIVVVLACFFSFSLFVPFHAALCRKESGL